MLEHDALRSVLILGNRREEFLVLEQLSASVNSSVYRALRKSDGLPVILKQLESSHHSLTRHARYHQEFLLSHQCSASGVVYALELLQDGELLTICFRDTGGYSLRTLQTRMKLGELSLFLPLAVRICRALEVLHRHHIIHKDINPSNIVWNADSDLLELIDLGLSTQLSQELPQQLPPTVLEGTLPYISPEQTGRMNRRLDYRSDFYSLGVTFYELLTGQLPYDFADPLELVHAHLAADIPSVRALRPELPPLLDGIVKKLMSKQAEDRYQTLPGLIADLETCYTLLLNRQELPQFELGLKDFSVELHLKEKLYGRESQRQALLNAFSEAGQGRPTLLLVSGYSGIGKSSLVHELYKPITARRGLFASGKFDQFTRGIAYSALSAALRSLVQQLLMEPETILQELRVQLREALGSGAGVAVELVPELTHLLGSIPPLEQLTGLEAQSRFNQVMQKLLRTLAQPQRPVVLFLDDLQWADIPSLNLLEFLLSEAEPAPLLFMGAYRDHEVQEGHPFMRMTRAVERQGTPVERIQLPPLTEEQLLELMHDTLNLPEDDLLPLVMLVHTHTLGNPFFVGQFLREIHRRGLLRYDPQLERWVWDVVGIEQQGFTDNVIDLLAENLRQLPPDTQRVLQLAACIGSQFSIDLLVRVLKLRRTEVVNALWPALESGFLESLAGSNLEALAQVEEVTGKSGAVRCRFVHDRIQQSAYQLLSEAEQATLHLQIGRQLLASLSPAEREQELFSLVTQLNQGRRLITAEPERIRLVQLNLEAAEKARRSTAYETAAQTLAVGRELMSTQPWEAYHALNFKLHLHAAECAYLLGHFEQADALYAVLQHHAQTDEEQLEIGVIQADHYLLQARHLEGLEVARSCFLRLGLDIPTEPDAIERALKLEIQRVQALLDSRSVEALLDLPVTDSPRATAKVRLAYGMFLNGFLSGQGTLAFLALAIGTRSSMEHGNCSFSGYIFVGFGMVLYLLQKDYALGHRFGYLGVRLSEHFPDLSTRCKANFLFAADVHNWTQPIRSGQVYYDRAYQLALESGDWVTLGYVVAQSASDRLTSGVRLETLLPILQEQRHILMRAQNEDGLGLLHVASLNPIQCLMEKSLAPGSLDTAEFSQAPYLQKHAGNHFYEAWCYAGHIRVVYLLGQSERFEECAAWVPIVEQYIPSHAKVPECCFYGALMRLELASQATTLEQQQQHQQELDRLLSRLREFAAACPANVQHRLELLLAEQARRQGRFGEALEHYENGIRLAKEAEMLTVEALGLELYARLWHDLERPELEASLLREARVQYAHWGASAVVHRLERAHPWAFQRTPRPSEHRRTDTLSITWETEPVLPHAATPPRRPYQVLDMTSMVQASHALSSQNDVEEASRNLLQIARINAGAQRCVQIEASEQGELGHLRAIVDETGTHPSPHWSLEEERAQEVVPLSVVRYVLRSQRGVLLSNAAMHGEFVQDRYIQQKQIRSVLCLPLQSQGQIRGALYLENNLSAGVFTPDRLELLQLLATQLAITMTNARLYHDLEQHKNNLEQLVQERTRALHETLETLKATQQELVRSARLAALGNTVAGVAHELNTPLGVALTAESLMSEELASLRQLYQSPRPSLELVEETLERVLEASQLTRQNLERAAQLVKTFKQVAVDRSHSELRALRIRSYLEEVLLSISPLVKRQLLTPSFVPGSANPDYVCDAGLLAQVLTNLLENAGLHAYQGRGGPVEIGISKDEKGIHIQVRDFGQGMSEEVAASAFDPFFTTLRRHGGSGLGLHIVHNAVTEGLGGQLTLTTKPGEGATFGIHLPLIAQQAQPTRR